MSNIVPFRLYSAAPTYYRFLFSALATALCLFGAILIFVLGVFLSGAKNFFTDGGNAPSVAAAEECDPPPQRDPPAGRGERTVTVRKGEALSSIAARYMPDDSAENIARLRARNEHRLADWERRCEDHLRRPGVCEDVVFAGGRLVIPAGRRR